LQLNENLAFWAPMRPPQENKWMATRFQVAFPTHTHPMMKRSSHVILKAGSAATSTGALQRNCADSSNRTPERVLRIRHHGLETFLRDIITSPFGIYDRTGFSDGWVNVSSLTLTGNTACSVVTTQTKPNQSLSRHRLTLHLKCDFN